MGIEKTENKRPIESYEHTDKRRANNPPVGVVTSISWLAPSLTQQILDGAAFGIPV